MWVRIYEGGEGGKGVVEGSSDLWEARVGHVVGGNGDTRSGGDFGIMTNISERY